MTPEPQQIPPERRQKVDAARQSWIRRLVDTSRRNNLLYFRPLKVGTLELTAADPDAMRRLLQSGRADSEGVRLADLVQPEARTQASASLAEINKKATSNYEERGLDTLFIAMGLATWTARDGGRDTSAPLLLLPLSAAQSGGRSGPWSLRRHGDIKLNDVLLHALKEEYGVTLAPEALLPEVLGDDEGEVFDLEPVFSAVAQSTGSVPGFAIEHRWVIGNFAFQKMAIVRDLKELPDALAAHDIVAGIAGDQAASEAARGNRDSIDARDLDRQLPDDEFLIRDADSSQQQAIALTLRGQNGVISGPPGTGKSQTISNLIAELVARGKTVLFVAEKRAALDVVLNRLDDADLGHLCLDCHGAELSRREIAQQFDESLTRVRETPGVDAADLHRRYLQRRDQLNAHARALHAPRAPWDVSLYTLYGWLLTLPPEAKGAGRLPKKVAASLNEHAVEMGCEQLKALSTLAGLYLGDSPSPWVGATITSSDANRRAIERARRIAEDLSPRLERAFARAVPELKLNATPTLGEFRQQMDLLQDVHHTLQDCSPGLFWEDLGQLSLALVPARSRFKSILARLFDSRFRAALKTVRGHVTGAKPTPAAALDMVVQADTQRRRWQRMVKGETASIERVEGAAADALRAAWSAVAPEMTALLQVFPGKTLDQMTLNEVGAWLLGLVSDQASPPQILRVHEITQSLTTAGLEPVLQDIRQRKPPPTVWPDVLRHAWCSACIDDIHLGSPQVAAFSGRQHDGVASEFRKLDEERLEVAIRRVQRAHAERAVAARNTHRDQDAIVIREAQKRSRHLPLRKLFEQAPQVLLALRPCWMASPLSVSQLIPGDRPLFDVVIFDEASQVLPEDAVTSLLRGRQAVIAGDKKQLPPTTFFAAGEPDDQQEDEATAGFQSILDVMSAFLDPPWSLDWHYRSRDEALIAYSNHRIYNGRLVTFPGTGDEAAVSHVLVQHPPGIGAQELSVSAEVLRVVDLVAEHARKRPDESLGVITMGIEHANRIEMALEKARREDPSLEDLLDPEQPERFFVKNLERVQGDERDAIVLSIGYAKSDTGQLHYRLGPLLQEGGERRLNVAITRARQRMTVVSSFDHHDVDPAYPKLGVQLLRGYLEYAASGGKRFEKGTVTDIPLNDFEQAVFDELTRRGLKLKGQVGSSRYRIDLVAMHPEQPGRFVLAIECDGASYHSAPTARDRDRLRQQQLEAKGWIFHRIWSTDWFMRREEEVQRVLQAFENAWRGRPEGLDAEPDEPAAARSVTGAVETTATRGPRPSVTPGLSIGQYSRTQLRDVVSWVLSDGRLHTDDEIVAHVMRELGFRRRGTKIVAAIEDAIRAVRR